MQERGKASQTAQPVSPESLSLGHEPARVNVRLLLLLALFVIVSAAVLHVALAGLFFLFASRPAETLQPASAFVEERPAAPPPRLQAAPAQDWQTYQAAQQAELNSYGWVDRNAGVVRIPIDRAMDLLVERGLPTGTATPAP